MNTKEKYTNPASRHSWLLQAKVVGPSYEAYVVIQWVIWGNTFICWTRTRTRTRNMYKTKRPPPLQEGPNEPRRDYFFDLFDPNVTLWGHFFCTCPVVNYGCGQWLPGPPTGAIFSATPGCNYPQPVDIDVLHTTNETIFDVSGARNVVYRGCVVTQYGRGRCFPVLC